MKAIAGIGLSLIVGGCSSAPLGQEPDAEVSSVQEEVALNAETSKELRLITRLYVSDYAALEWYQPRPGLVAFSVVQAGGIEPIDSDSLKGLKPTEVFKKFAQSLEVPEALAKLEAHPEVLQELSDRDAVEMFAPEADLKRPGVMPQAFFTISRGHSAFNCSSNNFFNQVCSGWDARRCEFDKTTFTSWIFSNVEESQTSVCSVTGTNQMRVWISGCANGVQPEPENWCDDHPLAGAGVWLDVSPGFLRSWHGNASSAFGIEDAYNHTGSGRRKSGQTGRFHYATRVFWD